jgi:hypothetical protein
LNVGTGPAWSLLSRTMTTWGGVATSTQLPSLFGSEGLRHSTARRPKSFDSEELSAIDIL